jgi:hypothetical protein
MQASAGSGTPGPAFSFQHNINEYRQLRTSPGAGMMRRLSNREDPMTTESFAAATPHGPLVHVAGDVHLVRGTFRMGPGLVISRTMTIIRRGADLTLVNALRLNAETERALLDMGRIAHVVALSDAHGLDDPYWVRTFGATYWHNAGARRTPPAPPMILGAQCPVADGKVFPIPNHGAPESALWLPDGQGTLVTCDVLQNHCDTEGASFFAKVMTPLLGFTGGVIVPRMWRKVHRTKDADVAQALSAVAPLAFENLVTAHGPAVIGGADRRVAAALARFASA